MVPAWCTPNVPGWLTPLGAVKTLATRATKEASRIDHQALDRRAAALMQQGLSHTAAYRQALQDQTQKEPQEDGPAATLFPTE